jgi:SNF2 family DNA or RNA helicase
MPKDPKDPPSNTHVGRNKEGYRSGPSGPSRTPLTDHLAPASCAVPSKSFAAGALPNGLASHQETALRWAVQRPVALLADATGSGKTAVAAALIGYAFDCEGAKKALWVTEANLIEQAMRELRRFLPTLQVNRWPGQSSDQVRVVSVETLTRHVGLVQAFNADVGVIDDAAIKGEGLEPAALAQVMGRTARRLCLNATPVELDATEAYRILDVLGAPGMPDRAVFNSFMEWQELPFGGERPYATRPHAVGAVREVFGRFVLRRGPDELGLALPELHDEEVLVTLTPAQRVAYRRADGARSPLAQASKREKACAFEQGQSAKAEAAVNMLIADPSLSKVQHCFEPWRS